MRYFKIKYGKQVEYYRVSPDGRYEFYISTQELGWHRGFEDKWEYKINCPSNKVEEVPLLELLVVLGYEAVSA